MPSLAEVQQHVVRAVLGGDGAALAPLLVGGARPLDRLAIHRRHYEASLTAALAQRFAGVAWLVGASAFTRGSHEYVRAHLPDAPCIAEYGESFPAFLAERLGQTVPYLAAFAELEWAVGRVSISVQLAPLAWADLAALGPSALLDARIALQPSVRYVRSAWRIDELFTTYVAGDAPASFMLRAEPAVLEIRGERGEFSIERLAEPVYELRSALAGGASFAEASSLALERDAEFDPGRALRELVEAGLATSVAVAEGAAR